jgi:small GTP-binding protein
MTVRQKKFKVVLMGASSVGKTSLVIRFSRNVFISGQESTIGAAFISREVETPKGTVALHVWDTAGQERYRALVPRYSQGAAAIIIVFDLSDSESLKAAKDWYLETKVNHPSGVAWFLVGNKCDLESVADVEEAREFAAGEGLCYMETSAKTGQNVNELFVQIAKMVPTFPGGGEHDPVELEKAKNEPADGGCC